MTKLEKGHFGVFVVALFTWIDAKIELFPVVQPDFCQSCVIVIDDL